VYVVTWYVVLCNKQYTGRAGITITFACLKVTTNCNCWHVLLPLELVHCRIHVVVVWASLHKQALQVDILLAIKLLFCVYNFHKNYIEHAKFNLSRPCTDSKRFRWDVTTTTAMISCTMWIRWQNGVYDLALCACATERQLHATNLLLATFLLLLGMLERGNYHVCSLVTYL